MYQFQNSHFGVGQNQLVNFSDPSALKIRNQRPFRIAITETLLPRFFLSKTNLATHIDEQRFARHISQKQTISLPNIDHRHFIFQRMLGLKKRVERPRQARKAPAFSDGKHRTRFLILERKAAK